MNGVQLLSAAGDYAIGLDASKVTEGFMGVVSDNILPVLTLMGIMFGVAWILKRFRKARKGSM